MKHSYRHYFPALIVLLALVLLPMSSCTASPGDTFYDAGAGDYTATGAEFVQNWLFRFDTAVSGRTFTTPSAADIVAILTSPSAGQVIVLGVTADGGNDVTLLGGTNVTIKPSASKIAGNTTLTIYCELDDVSSGSAAVTIY